MEKIYKNCQSCGMPMKKDPQGGGTNADGSKSTMYCSFCYQNGAFTAPDITVGEMQKLCQGKLKEMKFPGFVAWFLTRGIPRLERWRK
ncbi:MAG: zinc ribbon domain-containing protein [Patescibacteria group bacterium]|nr:zinc ribbon domain-containing protein [Patescibacteria group bacterium]